MFLKLIILIVLIILLVYCSMFNAKLNRKVQKIFLSNRFNSLNLTHFKIKLVENLQYEYADSIEYRQEEEVYL